VADNERVDKSKRKKNNRGTESVVTDSWPDAIARNLFVG